MTASSKSGLLILLLLGGAGAFLASKPTPVTFESRESKTSKGDPVFNRISYSSSEDMDVWDMRQSHDGINAPTVSWDHIQIRVRKKARPYQVSYHQLENGKEIEFKALCYTCHANGPRLIRPVEPLSLRDRIAVASMNLKIKSYGRMIVAEENHLLEGRRRKVPIKLSNPFYSQKLTVKTCTYCHNNSQNFLSRGELEKQHGFTIEHLTNTHEMPPWPLELSESEKLELARFIK